MYAQMVARALMGVCVSASIMHMSACMWQIWQDSAVGVSSMYGAVAVLQPGREGRKLKKVR